MENNDIKKDLECCAYGDCKDCTEYSNDSCGTKVLGGALELIKSQEQRIKELAEENERLRAENESLKTQRRVLAIGLKDFRKEIKAIKADTVREMQSELKKTFSALCKGEMGDFYRIIDQIAKEMLEGE